MDGVWSSVSWVFTGLMKRARDLERQQIRRLNEAYAHWSKRHRQRASRNPEQERRLLGSRERNDHREE